MENVGMPQMNVLEMLTSRSLNKSKKPRLEELYRFDLFPKGV